MSAVLISDEILLLASIVILVGGVVTGVSSGEGVAKISVIGTLLTLLLRAWAMLLNGGSDIEEAATA